MQNDLDVIQKAKMYIKRYTICCTVLGLSIVLGFWLSAVFGNVATMLSSLIAGLLLIFIGSSIIFNKCVASVLNKKLDAETYLAMISCGNLDTPAAIWQLYGEYFCGNYQNVVSICKMKLDDPKMAERYRYHYLTYLANVYFDIGDDENLRKVCEQYESALINEKPRKQARFRTYFSRMTFYGFYLNQNIEACMDWINKPAPMLITQYNRTFCKARLALMQGNTAEADKYFEALAKEAPQLNYGKLATNRLSAENPQTLEDRPSTFVISDEPTEVTLHPTNRRKLRKPLAVLAIVLILMYAVVGILRDLDAKEKYEREIESYRESIRVLVEEDYDGVKILDTFTLKNGEDIIDTMFICQTEKEIIVGCTYVYSDDPTKQYYKTMAYISVESLSEDRSPLWYWSFPSKTSHNQIESYFYTVKADVPADYVYLSSFEINGQKVYYVITEIIPGITITLSDQYQ